MFQACDPAKENERLLNFSRVHGWLAVNSAFLETKGADTHLSNTSTEAASLKLIFTKFACSVP